MSERRSALRRFDALHAGFIASTARWPDRPALTLGEESWTYAAVDTAARRLASGLLASSSAPKRVGILARRSFTSYTGPLGALFAGAAFVPLNPTLPVARLRAIVDIADLDAIIIEDKRAALLQPLLSGRSSSLPVLFADAARRNIDRIDGMKIFDSADIRALEPLRTASSVAPEDIAYILFTSGSTGVPKGVPISHANAASFLSVNLERYLLTPEDVLSQTFEQSFDLSIFDIFMAWSAGATLCGFTHTDLLAPLAVIQAREITVWFSVPSIVSMQLRLGSLVPGSLPTLRLSLFCGEPLIREHAEAWQAAAPMSVLENLYGPTELTIACAVHRWNPATSPGLCSNGIVPIGRLYDTLSWQVVDRKLEPVAPGETGELCVAGPQTFAGYWRSPEATAGAFYESADSNGLADRFYRTGDLVRELPNGELLFIGRRDHQIKLGGHRIELAEIEAALRAQPSVREAAALAWPDASNVEKIVAVVSGSDPDRETLRRGLRSTLPAYMIPAEIYVIEDMPRSSSGKLDRRGLRDLLADEMEYSDGTATRGEKPSAVAKPLRGNVRIDTSDTGDATVIAIVGGGFSGICLAAHLHRSARRPVRVLVFERTKGGSSVAFGTPEPVHFLNGPASNHSAFDDTPDDFVDFLANEPEAQRFLDRTKPIRRQFVPRMFYGRYLRQMRAGLMRSSRMGATVTFIHAEVRDVVKRSDGVEIVTNKGAPVRADAAVLALGHPPPRSLATLVDPRYLIDDPWDVDAVRAIPPQASVAIVGTGQTAVDLALSITANGHRGPVTLLSRRGRIAVPFIFADRPYVLDVDRLPHRLRPFIRWLRSESERFIREGGNWRAVINALRPHTQRLWYGFSLAEKRRFFEHMAPFWYLHRSRLAPQTAKLFSELLATPRVKVVAGRITGATANDDGVVLHFRPRGESASKEISAEVVINCTGPNWDISKPKNPLMDALVASGTVRWDDFGYGIAVTMDGIPLDASGRTAERLFAIGPICRGSLLEIMVVRDVRTQCATLASRLLAGEKTKAETA